jgi:hypothetical protein
MASTLLTLFFEIQEEAVFFGALQLFQLRLGLGVGGEGGGQVRILWGVGVLWPPKFGRVS